MYLSNKIFARLALLLAVFAFLATVSARVGKVTRPSSRLQASRHRLSNSQDRLVGWWEDSRSTKPRQLKGSMSKGSMMSKSGSGSMMSKSIMSNSTKSTSKSKSKSKSSKSRSETAAPSDTDMPTTATAFPTAPGATPVPTTPGSTPPPTVPGATNPPTTPGATNAPTTPGGTTAAPTTAPGTTAAPTVPGATLAPTTPGAATNTRSGTPDFPETVSLKQFNAATADDTIETIPVASKLVFKFNDGQGRSPEPVEIDALKMVTTDFFTTQFQNNPAFSSVFNEFKMAQVTPMWDAANPDEFTLEFMAEILLDKANMTPGQDVSGGRARGIMASSNYNTYIGNYVRQSAAQSGLDWNEFVETHAVHFTFVSN